MKYTLSLLFTLFFGLSQAQTLFVANNNPGAATGTNVFTGSTALQDALGASADGDVIYVVPSSTSYGDISITTAVTLFGAGLEPDKDIGTRTEIDMINIDASGVRVSGIINLRDELRIGWNSSGQNLDGIIIENSQVERILMTSASSATASNLLIRNNILTGNGSVATHILLYSYTSNTVVTNNVFVEGNIGGQPMIRGNDITYRYNIFADTGSEQALGIFSVNCLFDHNIFYNVSVNWPTTGCTFNYNLAFYPTDDALSTFNLIDNGTSGTGNISSVGGSNDPMFVNFPITQSWNDAYDISLEAGSPALNVNGSDIGPSGGANPFDPEGNVLPLIQSLDIPDQIPVGSDLPITIKAKGN